MIFEMVMGCTGSGKDTYARQRQLADWARVGYETTRLSMTKSFGNNFKEEEIAIEMLQRAKEFLAQGRYVVFDSKFLTAEERTAILNSIKGTFGKTVYCYLVFMDVPEEECIKRNTLRRGKTTANEIHKEFEELEKPTYAEGWDIIKTIGATK